MSLSILNAATHLLTCIVSGEMPALIPVFALLYVISSFLWLFKAFYQWLLPTWCSYLCFCSRNKDPELLGSTFFLFSQGIFYSGANLEDSIQFSSVQSLSHVRLFATPWIAARQASLSITNSQNSLRLMSIESVIPSGILLLLLLLLLLSRFSRVGLCATP